MYYETSNVESQQGLGFNEQHLTNKTPSSLREQPAVEMIYPTKQEEESTSNTAAKSRKLGVKQRHE